MKIIMSKKETDGGHKCRRKFISQGSESESSSTDVMALVNGKSPLNNPIFTGGVKQLFGGRGAVPLLLEPSDWTDTLKTYLIFQSPPTDLMDYAKTSDSDI